VFIGLARTSPGEPLSDGTVDPRVRWAPGPRATQEPGTGASAAGFLVTLEIGFRADIGPGDPWGVFALLTAQKNS
jgi:hypothetical protein